MALELRQQLKLSQQLVMTPQLQQAIKLLQLSRVELLETVQQELLENPFLEESSLTDDPSQEQHEESREAPKEEVYDRELAKDADWEVYLGEFASTESGAGAPLGAFTATPEWCKKCLDMADGTAAEWDEFCSSGLPTSANDGDKRECGKRTFLIDQERRNYCYARGCEK